MTLPYKILIAVAILLVAILLGGVIGWRLAGYSQAKAAEATATADVSAITASVQQQAATEQKNLQTQQDKTAALDAQQNLIRDSATNITLDIQHAAFTPPVDAGSCPDPVDSDDFVRLYGSAAKGGDAPAAASSASKR